MPLWRSWVAVGLRLVWGVGAVQGEARVCARPRRMQRASRRCSSSFCEVNGFAFFFAPTRPQHPEEFFNKSGALERTETVTV